MGAEVKRDDSQRAQQRDYKATQYADPAQREVLKERAREYGRRNSEKRKKYMKDYAAKKSLDPEFVTQERTRSREGSRVRRAALNLDPTAKRAFLDKRQDQRAGAVREREVEAYLVSKVKDAGGFCPKFVDPGRRGAPDRMVMMPGAPVIFVELKRPIGGEVSVSQQRYHAKLAAVGQIVRVLKSKPEVDTFMASMSLLC